MGPAFFTTHFYQLWISLGPDSGQALGGAVEARRALFRKVYGEGGAGSKTT